MTSTALLEHGLGINPSQDITLTDHWWEELGEGQWIGDWHPKQKDLGIASDINGAQQHSLSFYTTLIRIDSNT